MKVCERKTTRSDDGLAYRGPTPRSGKESGSTASAASTSREQATVDSVRSDLACSAAISKIVLRIDWRLSMVLGAGWLAYWSNRPQRPLCRSMTLGGRDPPPGHLFFGGVPEHVLRACVSTLLSTSVPGRSCYPILDTFLSVLCSRV